MRILFLDIDGVLNRYQIGYMDAHDETWEDDLVARINTLTDRHGLSIVITSDWRKAYSFETMQQVCGHYMGLTAEVVGMTSTDHLDDDYYRRRRISDTAVSRLRALQIQQWIDSHDVDHYIVVDDNIYAEYGHEDVFVYCDSFVGFDDDCLQEADYICFMFEHI